MTDRRSEDEPVFTPTKKIMRLVCPECDTVTVGRVVGTTRLWCVECQESWQPNDIENCRECGKPVTGSDVICHTCWTEKYE